MNIRITSFIGSSAISASEEMNQAKKHEKDFDHFNQSKEKQ